MENTAPQTSLSKGLILLMAVATGMVVASNYYAQPLLDSIANYFHISATLAGFIVTTAQLSYALGLMLLVPLGDIFERRSLIVIMTLISASGLLITAMAPNIWLMLIGTALSGMFSVVAQILVPFAATLAAPHQRGKAVGTIMSGLLLGILLARTASGLMASFTNWQGIFWLASVFLAILAITLWRCLPTYKSQTNLNYFQLLGSIFKLFATTPVACTAIRIVAPDEYPPAKPTNSLRPTSCQIFVTIPISETVTAIPRLALTSIDLRPYLSPSFPHTGAIKPAVINVALNATPDHWTMAA